MEDVSKIKIPEMSGIDFQKYAAENGLKFYGSKSNAENDVDIVDLNYDYVGDNGDVYVENGKLYEKQGEGKEDVILAYVNTEDFGGEASISDLNRTISGKKMQNAEKQKKKAELEDLISKIETGKTDSNISIGDLRKTIDGLNKDIAQDQNSIKKLEAQLSPESEISNLGDLRRSEYEEVNGNSIPNSDISHIETSQQIQSQKQTSSGNMATSNNNIDISGISAGATAAPFNEMTANVSTNEKSPGIVNNIDMNGATGAKIAGNFNWSNKSN